MPPARIAPEDAARALLLGLLRAADATEAGVRRRTPSVTQHQLDDYRQSRSLQAKESFEAVMKDARDRGAISLAWDREHDPSAFIRRVELLDAVALARLLGQRLARDAHFEAAETLKPFGGRYPVIDQVLERWRQLKKVRGLGPEAAIKFVDAARALDYLKSQDTSESDLRLRVASMAIFGSSKELEELAVPIGVLRLASINEEPVLPPELWQELGLVKDPMPALLAGRVNVVRRSMAAFPDTPYVGLAPAAVLGVKGPVQRVLTVENLTSFHAEAERANENGLLVIYTGGTPSPAWRAMYGRILKTLPAGVRLEHWGDLDEGGLRISAVIARVCREHGMTLAPARMAPREVPAQFRVPATVETVAEMCYWARRAGWDALAEEIAQAKVTFEQEGQERA